MRNRALNVFLFDVGDDLQNALYKFMDEFLFLFNTTFFISKEIKITSFVENADGTINIKATG
jgi:SHS2 domain-containing protein